MSRRLLSLPLLCLVLMHAVLGGGRGEHVICFGGHHEHHHGEHGEHPDHHDAAASLPCSLPGAIPVAYLSDCCTCPTVPIDLHELQASDRGDELVPAPPADPHPAAGLLAAVRQRPPDRLRPPRPPDAEPDPARRHHLAVLGITRLLT